MADDNSHPFNRDVIDNDTIVQIQKQLSLQKQPNIERDHEQRDIVDILFLNNRNSLFSSSSDSSFDTTLHSVSDDDFNRLKYFLRSIIWPINHHIRRQLWINVLKLNRISSSNQNYHTGHTLQTALTTTSMIIDNNLNSLSSKYNQWPNFVDTTNLCFYYLTEQTGHSLLYSILLTFASHHPDITFCPTLEPFAALLLHYHNEYEVLYLLHRLLIKNWLCGETRLQWEAYSNVFRKLLKHYFKSSVDIIDLRYKNTQGFYKGWFWWIFRYLPFSYLVKIMDCFLLEGPKILFRISLTLIHLFSKEIKRESDRNIQNIADFCQRIPVSIDHLLHIAFHIRNLKRRTIEQLIEHEEKLLHNTRHQSLSDGVNQNNNTNNGITPDRQSSFITIHHLPQIPQKSVLDHQQFLTLWNWLPTRLSLSQPFLVFSTAEDGFRLQTLLDKIDELEHSILIIKTTTGEIFGAFCAGLWSNRHNRTYFGCGESFLFTLIPKQIKYSWAGQQHYDNNRQSQLKRDMFLFVDNEKLIIGGGNGDGLCIDQSLCEGRTAHCETFNNEPLCSEPYFFISVLEMIAIDLSST
ncbi:unnamed protein product [Rotaria sp. Silwood2]|nr:unnamed protein product [Rotaria sp. Silwood2]CAF4527457.1 unnamed protein product [Rotaria sp. Silwood2]CAF4619636.1 unnamed protein product [Rotaria sp. Silwood2]